MAIAGGRAPARFSPASHGEGRRPTAQRARRRHAQAAAQEFVVDSKFETSPSARLLKEGQALVVGAVNDAKRITSLKEAGAEVMIIPNERGKVELFKLMQELSRRELNEIHVEAGTKLNGSLLQAGVVDELLVYLAPSVIGDSGRGMFHMPEITELSRASAFENPRGRAQFGADLRILART